MKPYKLPNYDQNHPDRNHQNYAEGHAATAYTADTHRQGTSSTGTHANHQGLAEEIQRQESIIERQELHKRQLERENAVLRQHRDMLQRQQQQPTRNKANYGLLAGVVLSAIAVVGASIFYLVGREDAESDVVQPTLIVPEEGVQVQPDGTTAE